MNLDKLFSLIERLQKSTIGDPVWVSKGVFEYPEQSIKVVVVLKAIRAAQGIKSLQILCHNGLFIDLGATFRCVNDCCSEIYFLLERYPDTSKHVDQFIQAFFEATIDGHLNTRTHNVSVEKIHSAMVRILEGIENPHKVREGNSKVYKTFCGYTHANYSHIMEIYGGMKSDLRFHLPGVPSPREREHHTQLVDAAFSSVMLAVGFVAQKFGLTDIVNDVFEI